MNRTLKALSALLTYPTAELQAATGEISEVLDADNLIPGRIRDQLHTLLSELATGDLYDLQERYVLLFDRSRSLSLHLFEHVHGESRDRGQAMVDLRSLYLRHGLDLDVRELPDYLPMFLEFLAQLPDAEAREHLSEVLHILTALRIRLTKRSSPYAGVFLALESVAGGKPDSKALALVLAEEEDDPEDGDALDRVWEEEQVQFGPAGPDSGCPQVNDMLARMAEDPASAAAPAKV